MKPTTNYYFSSSTIAIITTIFAAIIQPLAIALVALQFIAFFASGETVLVLKLTYVSKQGDPTIS